MPPMAGGSTGPETPPELDASATAESTSDDGSSSGGLVTTLISGLLLAGTTGVTPTSCLVRLHELDSLDPGSGLPVEIAAEISVDVDGLPQPYVMEDMAGFLVGPGDQVYVSALCDVDGDGAPDNLGAYYPQVPLEPVLLPAGDIDLTLEVVL